MKSLLRRWLINALGLLILPYIVTGIEVRGIWAALLAALVLGLVNALIRPFLLLVFLPLNLLTLGLFTLVINAVLLWLVAALVPGFGVAGFLAALAGALVLTLVSGLASWLITR
ncbi:MAG: phage holin family protein [Chloroflexi bacterium]|nr:phage holin family protein [Chloroflexota bacterium]